MTLTVETWCEALESGKYEQGVGRLRRGDTYCCFGVACDLSGIGSWLKGAYYIDDGSSVLDYLPASLQHDLKLDNEEGAFLFTSLPKDIRDAVRRAGYQPTELASLVGMNDAGVPFSLIAKVIRARPKGLFREDV